MEAFEDDVASSETTALDKAWEAGQALWPGVSVSREEFAAHVAAHAEDEAEVRRLHADMYLACSCANGHPDGLEAFEREVMPACVPALRRLDPSEDFCREVQQLLRQKLLVSTEERTAKIYEYAGRGPLSAWVRVSAVRTGLNTKAKQRGKQPVTVERIADLLPSDDPSLEYLKSRYSDEFNSSLRAAAATLAPRDRTLMRLKFVDELNIAEIGAIYDVHRATVARWLSRIQDELFEETRRDLESRLDLGESEFTSILRLVRSRIEFGMSVLLRSEEGT